MPEKDTVFSSKMKYTGIVSFKDFYKFCYDWLKDETKLTFVKEEKYSEKITAKGKDIDVTWKGERKVTDYFKFQIEVKFRVVGLTDVEVTQQGIKIKTNQGIVEIKVKGILIRDYEGKFETTAFMKFLRSIYEKWVIPSRVIQFEEKLISASDEFLNQAKAYLDLEGKR
ncbi:unnamed protein product [marine sediment metagenome]|uniref:Uncharacterized protein n=1 Tax=marine sediment metagenome TaxID=412755 RepID=X1LBP6_9ZZZZ